jgi:hypothetical protein
MAELEDDTLRDGLSMLLNMSAHMPQKDVLVNRGIVSRLFEETILESQDKRVRRTAARILVNLSNSDGKRSERHIKLLECGILYPIRSFLRNPDFNLRIIAAEIAAHICVSDKVQAELSRQREIMREIVALCNPHDEEVNLCVATLLAELSGDSVHYNTIVDAGGLQALMFMVSHRSKSAEVRREAVRCLANISTNSEIKQSIVSGGALGHLISMSKSGTGLTKLYATATITNLEHDTAAMRIQSIFRGFIARRFIEVRSKVKQSRASSRDGTDEGEEKEQEESKHQEAKNPW